MELNKNFPLVSCAWLAARMSARNEKSPDPLKNIVLLDASWHMPNAGRNAHQEFLAEHITGARFFDIDVISDDQQDLPHMLPNAEKFCQYVNGLGIDNQKAIIIYDSTGLFSAARAWWMFRYFGHQRVGILDGGLKAWKKLGFALEQGEPPMPEPYGDFIAQPQPHLLVDRQAVHDAIGKCQPIIVDMRSAGRFQGIAPEPRPNLPSGHMPHAINLPFTDFFNKDSGYIHSFDDLRSILSKAGLKIEGDYIASCGSGVTACCFAFILYLLGNHDVAVYDGSWAEWALHADNPIIRAKT